MVEDSYCFEGMIFLLVGYANYGSKKSGEVENCHSCLFFNFDCGMSPFTKALDCTDRTGLPLSVSMARDCRDRMGQRIRLFRDLSFS